MGFAGLFTAPKAKRGDSIAQAYEQFRREEEAWRIHFNGQQRQWRTPHGVIINVDSPGATFLHPWLCNLGPDNTVLIRQGRINLQPARIDGVTLDGKGADGAAAEIPTFQIPKEAKPNKDLESFVCAQVEIDLKTGKMVEVEKSPVTIVHLASPDSIYRDGGSLAKNQYGIRPLACVVWSDEKTIDRLEQIAMFDYTHEFKPSGTKNGRGRHFFWV